jgi:3-methyladenine DNA glycosylase Tag
MPTEHGAPKQITPKSLGDYLEVMSKSVFQSGISWAVVEKKWPGTRDAFSGFDAGRVAGMTERDVAKLAEDTRIIRNRRKIEGIIHNARKLVELDDKHGSFQKYLRSHTDFEALLKSLRKEFKFLGDMGAYHFLYVVKEKVPDYEEFCSSHGMKPMN